MIFKVLLVDDIVDGVIKTLDNPSSGNIDWNSDEQLLVLVTP